MFLKTKWLLRGAATFLVGILLTACQARSAGSITGVTIQESTGLVQSVEATVPTTLLSSAERSYFLVQTPAGSSTYWDVQHATTENGVSKVTLTLQGNQYRPDAGDNIFLYAVDPNTGRTTPLGSYAPKTASATILNPSFSSWSSGDAAHAAPSAWRESSSGQATLQQLNPSGVRLVANGSGQSSSLTLTQAVQLSETSLLHVRMAPHAACEVQGGTIKSFSGVVMEDSRGASVLYCVGNHGIHELRNSFQIVVELPGQLNRWNDFTVDPSDKRIKPYSRLVNNAEHPLTLSIKVETSHGTASADFRTVELLRGSPVRSAWKPESPSR